MVRVIGATKDDDLDQGYSAKGMAALSKTVFVLTLGLGLGSYSTGAWAVTVAPGGVYQGPATLEVPGVDVQFKLPSGFTGKTSDEGMAIGHKTEPGIILATVRAKASVAEIKSELAGPIALDESTVLTLKGKIKTKNGLIVAHYTGPGIAGYAAVRRHPSGRAIGFIGATTVKNMKRLKKRVTAFAKSAKFVKPSQSNYWQQFVGNKNWKYMNTGGGSSTRTSVSLCADGRFTYYGSTSVFSSTENFDGSRSTVSGLSRGGNRGTWKAYGSPDAGRLALTYDGDSEPTIVNIRREKTRLFVNGTRYINDTRVQANCN